jgi:ERCC4-related helicase
MRREYPDDSYKALSILSSITTVADLHQALETRGISSFVAEVLRLRLRQLFPKDPARTYGSRSGISAPQYVTRITEGALLKQAFERVAPPVVRDLWQAQALEKTVGAQTSDWLKLSDYTRAKRYQELLKTLNERIFNDLVACDYYDSPKERYLIQRMADERKRYYIAVGRIERAKFLAKRLTTILKDQIALPLTGPGSSTTKGISASERKANLRAINSGKAQHLVCTSCGEEGLDIVMEEGASEEFTSSARSSSQRQGRVARKVSRGDSELSRRMNSSGCYDLLLSSIRDYTRMLSILQKGIAMQMMLNAERSAFSPKSSNSNSGALRTPLLPLKDFE